MIFTEVWSSWSYFFKNLSETQSVGLVFLVSGTLALLIQRVINNKNSPPGPWGLPVVGHLPLLGKKPYLTFMEIRKKYGDIFSLRFGSWPTVVLNGNAIKEALCTKGDAFSGRPQYFSSVCIHNGKSLGFGKYDGAWRLHRQITNSAFLAFATAKRNPVEEIVHEEIDNLLSEFREYKGKAFDPYKHVFTAIASVIYQICYGRNESIREDKEFCEYILHTKKFATFVSAGNPIDMYPWLQFVMKKKVRDFKELLAKGQLIRRKRMKEHKETFEEENLRDIADSLINASRKLSEVEKTSGMTEERVLDTIGEMFAAGFDTVATTTMWAILLLAKHPHVQKKVQDELDEVVGNSRRPSLSDRSRLVYLQATLHEIMRFDDLLPLSLAHSTTEDVRLGGYTIKKDTVVVVNLHSLSHDPEFWGDPECFRPERFLTAKGEIDTGLVERFLPFSTGRRRCIGESLARLELFHILSGLLQKITFVKPKSAPDYTMDCLFGVNQRPLPYMVEVHSRE